MVHIIFGIITVIAAWKWGDWRNFKQYLSTIQYFIIGDMLYNLLTWDNFLWFYPNPPNLLQNHLLNNLFIMFIIYPSTMLLFLYRLPKANRINQFLYFLSWIAFWLIYEFFMVLTGQCVYDNGWTYGWSTAFVLIMVPMLFLHYKRPLWAYILSIPITLFFIYWFQVPIFNH